MGIFNRNSRVTKHASIRGQQRAFHGTQPDFNFALQVADQKGHRDGKLRVGVWEHVFRGGNIVTTYVADPKKR